MFHRCGLDGAQRYGVVGHHVLVAKLGGPQCNRLCPDDVQGLDHRDVARDVQVLPEGGGAHETVVMVVRRIGRLVALLESCGLVNQHRGLAEQALFDGGGGDLQAGMFSRLAIRYDQREDALVVPRRALLEDGGEPAVFAIRDGKASRVALELGYSDGGWVEVRKGLGEGDAVVVAGKAALREGTAVQVLGDAVAAKDVAKAETTDAAKRAAD